MKPLPSPDGRTVRRLLAVLCLMALAWAVAVAASILADWRANGWHLVVDGRELLAHGHLAGAAVGLVLAFAATLLALLAVPLTLLLVFGVLALVLLAAVGLPLLAVAALVVLVTSPLWLFVALLWWALRPPRRRASIAA